MADLDDLYQETILDHGRSPRNFRTLPAATHRAEGFNPLCGDRVVVELCLGAGDRIEDIAFTGAACAICLASASMMTEQVKGHSAAVARTAAEDFRRMLVDVEGQPSAVSHQPAAEGTQHAEGTLLQALAGVRRFPMRVKCATLPWHTLLRALEGGAAAPVSTE